MSEQHPREYRWDTVDSARPLAEAFDFEAFRKNAEVVKQTPAKQVFKGEWRGEQLYVKRYFHGAVPLRSLRYWFQPTRARLEWLTALRMHELAAPVVRYLALAERFGVWGVSESLLITAAAPGGPLSQVTFPHEGLLRFIEQQHALGVLQKDLHPNNLLFDPLSQQFCWVDVDRIRIKNFTAAEQRDNLALLSSWVNANFDATTRARGQQIRRAQLKHRSRRALKHNREFSPQRLGNLRWQVRTLLVDDEVRAILRAPEAFIQASERLKSGRSATVVGNRKYVLKRNNWRKWYAPLRDALRGSRAHRTMRAAYHLELTGIPTALPIAAGHLALVRSYFLMERVPGRVLAEEDANNRAIQHQLMKLLAKLHNQGFSHRDLKPNNLMMRPDGELVLIDLDGLRFSDEVKAETALRDLWRLHQDFSGRLSPRATIRLLFRYAKLREIPHREFLERAALFQAQRYRR